MKTLPHKNKSRPSGQSSQKVRQMSGFMGQKMLEFFYEQPTAQPTVRDLAAALQTDRSTAHRYLQSLKEQGVVSSDNQWVDTWQNRLEKWLYHTKKIAKSGLVEYLEGELAASAIILFGSFSKGESVQESDIDIFVESARKKEVDLRPFEKKLGHKIQLFIEPKITRLPTHLLNNVINGIKLKGYFTIK